MITEKEYAVYASAFAGIEALLREREEIHIKTPVIIGVDGRCGSGKTYFAKQLADSFPSNVIHMDDFYLPMEMRTADWENISGGNMDFERLLTEVLCPLKECRQAVYCSYDCKEGKYGEPKELQEKPLAVVEGSYSGHPLLAGQYSLKLFFTCSQKEQEKRLRAREGNRYDAFAARWIPLEEAYFARYAIEMGSNLIIDTSGLCDCEALI